MLIVLVFGKDAASDNPQDYVQARPLTIFLTGLAVLWFGCSNSAREIVGEWATFRRERMVGLRLVPYLFSKFAVLGALCVSQCFVLLVVIAPLCDWHARFSQMYAFTLAAALSGLAIGLCVSALARTSEMAVGLLPLILIPMGVLGGAMLPIHKMPKLIQAVAYLMPSRWTFEGMLVAEADAMNQDEDASPAVGSKPGSSVPRIDLAHNHFPQDRRFTPNQSFTWLLFLFVLQAVAAHSILRSRSQG